MPIIDWKPPRSILIKAFIPRCFVNKKKKENLDSFAFVETPDANIYVWLSSSQFIYDRTLLLISWLASTRLLLTNFLAHFCMFTFRPSLVSARYVIIAYYCCDPWASNSREECRWYCAFCSFLTFAFHNQHMVYDPCSEKQSQRIYICMPAYLFSFSFCYIYCSITKPPLSVSHSKSSFRLDIVFFRCSNHGAIKFGNATWLPESAKQSKSNFSLICPHDVRRYDNSCKKIACRFQRNQSTKDHFIHRAIRSLILRDRMPIAIG